MQTAAGLRFLRVLTRLGETTPAYLASRPRTPSTPSHDRVAAAARRPVAPSIRVNS